MRAIVIVRVGEYKMRHISIQGLTSLGLLGTTVIKLFENSVLNKTMPDKRTSASLRCYTF